jgi:nucleoside-diphosphate-sugar epimerase
VKRVVITSSFAAIVNPDQHPKVYSEKEWNPVTWEEGLDHSKVYRASKVSRPRDLIIAMQELIRMVYQTFAEKAAWNFVKQEKPNFDIATINPPLVFGPVVHYLNSLEAINTSNQRMRNLIRGDMKEKLAPSGTFLWVDVRDVALAHVRAIEVPEAGGERFFVTAGFFTNKDIADVIRDTHPELESKLPPKDSPSDLPKDIYGYDNSKSQKVLGIKYVPLKKTVVDTVDSLLAVGA